jgi:hypothetical protein
MPFEMSVGGEGIQKITGKNAAGYLLKPYNSSMNFSLYFFFLCELHQFNFRISDRSCTHSHGLTQIARNTSDNKALPVDYLPNGHAFSFSFLRRG